MTRALVGGRRGSRSVWGWNKTRRRGVVGRLAEDVSKPPELRAKNKRGKAHGQTAAADGFVRNAANKGSGHYECPLHKGIRLRKWAWYPSIVRERGGESGNKWRLHRPLFQTRAFILFTLSLVGRLERQTYLYWFIAPCMVPARTRKMLVAVRKP